MKMVSTYTVPAELSHLSAIRHFVTQVVNGYCTDEDFLYDLTLAVDEAVTNIIVHGYYLKPGEKLASGNGTITILIEPFADRMEVILRDHAPQFNPTLNPEPDFSQPIEKRKPGGMGIFLVRELTDRMEYKPLPAGGNELRLVKLFPHP